MSTDIQSQINYLKERISGLKSLAMRDESIEEIISEIRNTSQDILNRERRLLDNIIFDFLEREVVLNLKIDNKEDREKYERSIQFPICNNKEVLINELTKMRIPSTNSCYLNLLTTLDESQPYRGNKWISELRDWSNYSHRKLIPQEKKKYINMKVGGSNIRFVNANMSNVDVNGTFIDTLQAKDGEVMGGIPKHLEKILSKEVDYVVEGTNINIISLCEEAFGKIEKIAKRIDTL